MFGERQNLLSVRLRAADHYFDPSKTNSEKKKRDLREGGGEKLGLRDGAESLCLVPYDSHIRSRRNISKSSYYSL